MCVWIDYYYYYHVHRKASELGAGGLLTQPTAAQPGLLFGKDNTSTRMSN
jgi:hypothetical protein